MEWIQVAISVAGTLIAIAAFLRSSKKENKDELVAAIVKAIETHNDSGTAHASLRQHLDAMEKRLLDSDNATRERLTEIEFVRQGEQKEISRQGVELAVITQRQLQLEQRTERIGSENRENGYAEKILAKVLEAIQNKK